MKHHHSKNHTQVSARNIMASAVIMAVLLCSAFTVYGYDGMSGAFGRSDVSGYTYNYNLYSSTYNSDSDDDDDDDCGFGCAMAKAMVEVMFELIKYAFSITNTYYYNSAIPLTPYELRTYGNVGHVFTVGWGHDFPNSNFGIELDMNIIWFPFDRVKYRQDLEASRLKVESGAIANAGISFELTARHYLYRQPRKNSIANPYIIAGAGHGALLGNGVSMSSSFAHSAGAGLKIYTKANRPEFLFDVRYAGMAQSGRYDSYIPIRFGVRTYIYGKEKMAYAH